MAKEKSEIISDSEFYAVARQLKSQFRFAEQALAVAEKVANSQAYLKEVEIRRDKISEEIAALEGQKQKELESIAQQVAKERQRKIGEIEVEAQEIRAEVIPPLEAEIATLRSLIEQESRQRKDLEKDYNEAALRLDAEHDRKKAEYQQQAQILEGQVAAAGAELKSLRATTAALEQSHRERINGLITEATIAEQRNAKLRQEFEEMRARFASIIQ